MIRVRLVLVFFLFICFSTYGQDYFANMRRIGTEDGLSHYKILSFFSEAEGMWIGAADGLNFYDGYNWQYWKKENDQLNIEKVNYIYKDKEGLLWLFAAENINMKRDVQAIDILNQDRDSVFSFEQKFGAQAPFKLNAIQHFFEDKKHRLYCFANDKLWRYSSEGVFQLMPMPQDFEPRSVFSDGTYVGRLSGKLVLVSSDGKLCYSSDYLLDDEGVEIIGSRQKFWVSQKDRPLRSFERKPEGNYKIAPFAFQGEKEMHAHLLYFDEQQNHLWLQRAPNIFLFDQNEKLLYQREISPWLMVEDYNGNLWTTKNEIDVLQLQKKRFNRYLYQDLENKWNGETLYRCRGMVEKDGKLYVNSYQGARIVDLETKETSIPFEKKKRTFVALKTRAERIIFANRKVFLLDEQDVPKPIIAGIGEIPDRTWAMFEDRNGRIWSGNQGLSYLENGIARDFDKYNEFEELKKATVLFFFEDKNNLIWIGSDKGLYQWDLEKGILAAYGKNKKGLFELPSSKFQHMHQDAQGIFWLATKDAGLIRWNKANGNIQRFGKEEGMLSNNIYGVYEDDYGCLWMSSFNGLIRFQKESKSITVYTEEEGINNNEFNRISHYQSDDGSIFFGGQNGVTGFHPKDFQEEKSKQETFDLELKHVSIFGQKVLNDTLPDGAEIDLMNLNSGARVIDFEVFGSDLFWTGNFKLHYTLESLDKSKGLVPIIDEKISLTNHIQLFNMQPGQYNLRIKAMHTNGKQLGTTMEIPMKIAKPIFHRPSFWLGVLIALGLGIWGFLKLRMAHMRSRQIELEEMVTERTKQILKDQKVIQTQAEQIEVMKDQLNRKDERWLEQFQEMINERLEDSDLYLPDIIEEMDISRSAFYEKVKTLTRMTPNQYIQEIRLTKAKAILDKGNVKTVKEVAFAIGMKRPSYFSKLFKERFGITPSAYFRDHSN